MKLTQSDKKQLSESLLHYAQQNGADQVAINISESKDFSVDIRNQNIEHLEEAGSTGISIKVICDQKVATASSSDFNKDQLKALVKRAIQRAQLSGHDSYCSLPEFTPITCDIEKLNLVDPNIKTLSANNKVDFAKQTEALCLNDDRIHLSHGASFSTFIGSTHLINSNGFEGYYEKTNCSCGVYLQVGSDDNMLDEGWSDTSIHFENLQSPEVIAQKAIHRATRLIGAKKVKTQNVPVVLEPSMTASLMGFITQCVSGRLIYMKQSLLAGRLGEQIGNTNVMITDLGPLPGALGSRPFDNEGVATKETIIFDEGKLNSYMLDTYSARKLNMKSTGHASGTNNLIWQPGESTQEEIIKSIDSGLLLTGFLGFGLNAATGDISRGACGLWIENGDIAFPVAEITVSGNLLDILQGIEMVGNDPDYRRSVVGPTIKINEMTVGGI